MASPWDPCTPVIEVTSLHSRGHSVHLIFRASPSSRRVVSVQQTSTPNRPQSRLTTSFLSKCFVKMPNSWDSMNFSVGKQAKSITLKSLNRIVVFKRQVALQKNRDFKDKYLISSFNSYTWGCPLKLVMACLHCHDMETETDKKNGLYRTVWRCASFSETKTDVDFPWGLYTFISIYICEWSITTDALPSNDVRARLHQESESMLENGVQPFPEQLRCFQWKQYH